jgi:hypothetical protein
MKAATARAGSATICSILNPSETRRTQRLRQSGASSVPVVLRHNELLELNLAEYHGSVTLAELEAVAAFMAQNPSFLKFDCLSLVLPGGNFDGVELTALDRLFGRYKVMYAPIDFQLVVPLGSA